ncbi:hypothetical protein R6Q57_005764 [Mikania cordata]
MNPYNDRKAVTMKSCQRHVVLSFSRGPNIFPSQDTLLITSLSSPKLQVLGFQSPVIYISEIGFCFSES